MNQKSVVIFDLVETEPLIGRPTRARGGDGASAAVKAVETSTDLVEESLKGFVDTVKSMLEAVEEPAGNYHLDTVEIAAQISTEGKVGFMGVGVAAKGMSSMKIVFKRREE